MRSYITKVLVISLAILLLTSSFTLAGKSGKNNNTKIKKNDGLITGYLFDDANNNGSMDTQHRTCPITQVEGANNYVICSPTGETGLANQIVTLTKARKKKKGKRKAIQTTKTDMNGQYFFSNLRPGFYKVSVESNISYMPPAKPGYFNAQVMTPYSLTSQNHVKVRLRRGKKGRMVHKIYFAYRESHEDFILTF